MKKPIILHVTPSLMIGGAEKLLLDLLTNFKTNPDNLFEHQVAYFQAGPFLDQIKQLNIKTYPVTGAVKYWDPTALIRLFLLIKKIKPYKIHSMLWIANFYARLISKLLKIPVICAIHSYYNNGNLARDSFIKQQLDQLTLNWAEQIVVVSAEIAQKLALAKYQLKPSQVKIILNGVQLPNQAESKKLNTLKTCHFFTIGHIGRLVPVKNQILLIQALSIIKAQTKNFKAIIIGSGELESSLKKLTHALDLTKQINFIKTNQAKLYIPRFDCFVLPSHQEGLSIALLEAMSFGVTPIITGNSDRHDVVKNQHNGLICPPNQPYQLAQAILSLKNTPALNAKLAQNARITIEKQFNLHRTAKLYLSAYQYK